MATNLSLEFVKRDEKNADFHVLKLSKLEEFGSGHYTFFCVHVFLSNTESHRILA